MCTSVKRVLNNEYGVVTFQSHIVVNPIMGEKQGGGATEESINHQLKLKYSTRLEMRAIISP